MINFQILDKNISYELKIINNIHHNSLFISKKILLIERNLQEYKNTKIFK